jgi:N-acyl-D-amino-acid deacylase
MRSVCLAAILIIILTFVSCTAVREYDLIFRNGTIYDGSGGEPFVGDVAVNGDTIVLVSRGPLTDARGKREIDAAGLAVAPGFINMLSWANESLLADGRSQSEIRQGVTLEVMGEGWSMGPLSEEMKRERIEQQGDIKYDIEWTTLGEYLDYLEKKGVSCNVASFVGATSARIYVIGYENRPPTDSELQQMKELVRQAMEEGAMGLSTALEYVPAVFSNTDEIIALAKPAAEYDGMYISHLRDEGNDILAAIDEFLEVAREANIRSEIYHLKVAGEKNWTKLEQVFAKIEEAQARGLPVTADMYTYSAAATNLSASLPPWVLEGGQKAMMERLRNPSRRAEAIAQLRSADWEGFYQESGPEKMMLVGFKSEKLKPLTGKTLAEIAAERGTSPEDAMIDLIIEDDSGIGTIYFMMNEENVKKKIAKPWVSFGSDEASQAPEGVFLKSNPHPRAYGTFARLLGKYVRDEKIIPLQEAIRRLTSQPAANLKIASRGALKEGYFADIVVFDPAKVQDHAAFDKPHQYATGVVHVFVNGVQVLKDGEHTGATPGRVVRGPGWKGSGDEKEK